MCFLFVFLKFLKDLEENLSRYLAGDSGEKVGPWKCKYFFSFPIDIFMGFDVVELNIFFGGRNGENGEYVQNNSIYDALLKKCILGPWCESGPTQCKLAELLRSYKLCPLY